MRSWGVSAKRRSGTRSYDWGQTAFQNFKGRSAGPRASANQVNLEYLARVVCAMPYGNRFEAYPDSVVGTDSHNHQWSNALGVFGWGCRWIEAEAGPCWAKPSSMLISGKVVGVRLARALERRARPQRISFNRYRDVAKKRRRRKIRGSSTVRACPR